MGTDKQRLVRTGTSSLNSTWPQREALS